ncbi:homoserine kinase [Jeotgalibacillus campisalis]|uniref:Homoserine kinase n=1 Tax=Jeotgalibacillus campisalis TaxID=220754 RepID=A0A0C2VG52_9BACL|nr:homoserine kinase [Jeotgalibacillus campisalis]KIL47867.1 homoserine kinase [Jeotgalibacillus campisalis]
MTFSPFQVHVPATTANLGPGFDSIGAALNIHQNTVVTPSSKWTIQYEEDSHRSLPTDESNLILSTIRKVEQHFNVKAPAASLSVASQIPLSRGMGSSAAAIVTAIDIADSLLSLSLTDAEKITMACEIEGHPDNVSAAVLGGITVSRWTNKKLDSMKIQTNEVDVLLLVPSHELTTVDARKSIPDSISHSSAVRSSAAANLMIAALLNKDWNMAGKMMEQDEYHEPYRVQWIDSFYQIRTEAGKLGAYATTISGAGPAITIFCGKNDVNNISSKMNKAFPHYSCVLTSITSTGSAISPVYLKENV